jgi:hypothetical protein
MRAHRSAPAAPAARAARGRATGIVVVLSMGAAAILGGGCGGADPDTGLGAYFRVNGGQFVAGALDSTVNPNPPGPAVHSISSNTSRLYPGVQNKSVSGTVDEHANAVAIGIAGDSGYWIVPVAGEDQNSPPDLTFSARGSFSPTLPAGPVTLVFRAADVHGVMGPPSTETLTLVAAPVDGAFVISLSWDSQADLDLHVVAPATGGPGSVEVWSKRRTTLATRGPADPPFTADELAAAGTLDFDSNSGCVFDGRNNENVVWTQPPPSGDYTVRVDAVSMCGAVAARWHMTAVLNGTLQAEAFGQMGDIDTTRPHVAGAGLTVLATHVL